MADSSQQQSLSSSSSVNSNLAEPRGVYITTNDILSMAPKSKISKILSKPKQIDRSPSDLPYSVLDTKAFSFNADTASRFNHSAEIPQTNIALIMNNNLPMGAPMIFKEPQDFLRKVASYITHYAYNNEYSKRANVVRNIIKLESFKAGKDGDAFLSFTKELFNNVYKPIYHKRPNLITKNFNEVRGIEPFKDRESLLTYDFTNDSIIATVGSMTEALNKITDDEASNYVFLSSHNFLDPINWLLSPAALSIAYFNYQLLNTRKPHKEENYYTKQSLTKVTYICFTGIYSEIDIDIIYAISDNVQIIMIYDENTGGPAIISNKYKQEDRDFRKTKRHFHTISNRLLLIPLKCPEKSTQKSYSPNDILAVFEEIVLKALSKFKSSYIVLNCSLTFEENNKTPFILDETTLACIVNMISTTCDNKILVYPFKLPDLRVQEIIDHTAKSLDELKDNKEDHDRLRYIIDTYSVTYNEEFFSNCFVAIFEVLSGLSDPKTWSRNRLMKMYGDNPIKNEILYRLIRYYKSHINYNFLYSKAYGALARLSNQEFNDKNKPVFNIQKKQVNFVTIRHASDDVVNVTLRKANETNKEITLDSDSQYLVDYNNPEEPLVYIFNGKFCETHGNTLKMFDPLSNFSVSLEREEPIKQCSVEGIETYQIEDLQDIEPLKDSGLCKCGPFVFQVNGSKIGKNEDSSDIYYFDFEAKKHYKVEISQKNVQLMPRHGVTACAFIKDNTWYLYVFGGHVKQNTIYLDRTYGGLDIIDLVEIYSTNDPRTSRWNYEKVDKNRLCIEKSISYIPFDKSFAHYVEKDNKILLMGGQKFAESVYNWTFPVYEFSIKEKKFTSFRVILNDVKDNSYRKKIKNNEYNYSALTVPIASSNKNVWCSSDKGLLDFIIPGRDENRTYIYSYNYVDNTSTYLDIQNEAAEKPAKIPPLVLKEKTLEGGKKELNTRISSLFYYEFTTVEEKESLIRLLEQWMNINMDKLEKASKEELIKILGDNSQESTNDTNDTIAIQVLKKFELLFLNDEETEKMLRSNDIKIETIINYIKDNIESKEVDDSNTEKAFILDQSKFVSEAEVRLGQKIEEISLQIPPLMQAVYKIDQHNPIDQAVIKNLAAIGSSLETHKSFKNIDSKELNNLVANLDQFRISAIEDSAEMSTADSLSQSFSHVQAPYDKREYPQFLDNLKSIIKIISDSPNRSFFDSGKILRVGHVCWQSSQLFEKMSKKSDVGKVLNDSFLVPEKSSKVKEQPVFIQPKKVKEEAKKREKEPKDDKSNNRYYRPKAPPTEGLDQVVELKKSIEALNNCRMMFNGSKSEIILIHTKESENHIKKRLRFKVETRNGTLEDISFEFSPSSVAIWQSAVVCFIDQYARTRYRHIFEDYKYWILYADLRGFIAQKESEDNKVEDLIFRKLFLNTQNHELFHRCVLLNDENLFLFGGQSLNFKSKKALSVSDVVHMFNLKKLKTINQRITDFRETDTDKIDSSKGECVSIFNGKFIFICKRTEPKELEIFNSDGTSDTNVEFPKVPKGASVRLALVNVNKKDRILFTFLTQDKPMEFLLFDIKGQSFEEDPVKLVPKDLAKEDTFSTFYSGFEEIEVNKDTKPLSDVLLYNFRESKPKTIACEIRIGDD